jgi:hypothetical protein
MSSECERVREKEREEVQERESQLSTKKIKLKKKEMVKLSGWFVFSCKLKFFGYWDPGESAIFGEVHPD